MNDASLNFRELGKIEGIDSYKAIDDWGTDFYKHVVKHDDADMRPHRDVLATIKGSIRVR